MAPGQPQPGGAGPHAALAHPNSTLCPCCQCFPGAARSPLEGQTYGGAERGSRDTLMGRGLGRLGQPPALFAEGAQQRWCPQPAHRHHVFPQEENKFSALFSGAEQSPGGDLMPHRCSPHGAPRESYCLQAQNRLLLVEQKGMWAYPQDPLCPSLPAKTKPWGCGQKEAAAPDGRGGTSVLLPDPHNPTVPWGP